MANNERPEPTLPGTRPPSGSVCTVYDVEFCAPQNQDWTGSDPATNIRGGPGTSAGGRFEWRTKLLAGYWPVVESIAVWGNVFATIDIAETGIVFGFANPEPNTAPTGECAGVRQIIFSGPIPTGVAPLTPGAIYPSIFDSNTGSGYVVPRWNGLPMAFFIDSAKGNNIQGLTATLQWHWTPMEDIR